jgi:hypothetical protein
MIVVFATAEAFVRDGVPMLISKGAREVCVSKDMVKNNFPDCLRRSILTTEDVPD